MEKVEQILGKDGKGIGFFSDRSLRDKDEKQEIEVDKTHGNHTPHGGSTKRVERTEKQSSYKHEARNHSVKSKNKKTI